MSSLVERLVRDKSTLTGSAKSVLLSIAGYVDDNGNGAYPSVPTIAAKAGLSIRAVQYGLKKAVQAGELRRIYNYGPNGTNCYEIILKRLQGKTVCTGAESAYKGSALRGNQYSSLRSVSSPEPVITKPYERISRPKPQRSRLWAKRGNSDWECPICLKVGCPGCPGYMTDEELNAGFDAAMRDTLDAGKSGPAQVTSEAALKAHNDRRKPMFLSWQLTADRKRRIDSMTGNTVELPPLPHGTGCFCAYCHEKQRSGQETLLSKVGS